MKLLFDLFPIILFFIAFKAFDIYVATTVAIAATIVQIVWTKWRHGKVDVMLWVSFVIIAVFGGATLMLHDATFIKLKPTVLYWLFSLILLFSNIFFNKNMMRALLHEKIALMLHVWHRVNLMWSLFFALLGIINLYVASNFSEDAWVNFKLFGFTGFMLVFILVQSAWLAKYVDEKKESNLCYTQSSGRMLQIAWTNAWRHAPRIWRVCRRCRMKAGCCWQALSLRLMPSIRVWRALPAA